MSHPTAHDRLTTAWTERHGRPPTLAERMTLEAKRRLAASVGSMTDADRGDVHTRGGCTFRSVNDAMDWYFSRSALMLGPSAMQPRTGIGPDGCAHVVSVDGGRGGDLHEVLVTLGTISKALAGLSERAGAEAAKRGRPPAVPPDSYAWILRAHLVGIEGAVPPAAVAGTHGARKGAPWTAESIAQELGVGRSTVQRHIGIALAVLRGALEERGVVSVRE